VLLFLLPQKLDISSDEQLSSKIVTVHIISYAQSCHHLLHRTTVSEIDLMIDNFLTASLAAGCNFIVIMSYHDAYYLLYCYIYLFIIQLRFDNCC